MVSNIQYLFPRLSFASSQVPFSGYWHWLRPLCCLAQVRKYLWRCENVARRSQCSSLLHHREIYIEHTYRSLTMSVRTESRNWILNAEQSFCLVETGLQLQAGTGSFPSTPSCSIEIHLHMTYLFVGGRGKKRQITRLHCTCQTTGMSSGSGKSTSGGGQAWRAALNGGCRA